LALLADSRAMGGTRSRGIGMESTLVMSSR
jgi:hypothetical protein